MFWILVRKNYSFIVRSSSSKKRLKVYHAFIIKILFFYRLEIILCVRSRISALEIASFDTSCSIQGQSTQRSCNKILQGQTRKGPSGITGEQGWWSAPIPPCAQRTTLSYVIIDVPCSSVSPFTPSYRRKCLSPFVSRSYPREFNCATHYAKVFLIEFMRIYVNQY